MQDHPPPIELLEELGSGATGRVWLGRLHEPVGGLGRGALVALKRLHPELSGDARALTAFQTEARIGREVENPSLVRVLAHGSGPEGPWLLMQHVPGRSLREAVEREGPLPEPLVRRTGAQLAGALAALHARGLAHGDLKPENIRLDGEDRAVLLDLGFVRATTAGDDGPISNPGSLAYLSPERARGGPPTATGDVYALGLVLYELATGQHPFAGPPASGPASAGAQALGFSSGQVLHRALAPGADELLARLTTARFVPPSRLAPQLSPFFDACLESTLARRPLERPTAAELARRFGDGESGDWWRGRVDQALSGRGTGAGPKGPQHLSPLVGRERELRLLEALWGRPQAGLRTALLDGEAGSGKSRLMHEFAARARLGPHPPLYLYARCSEFSEARPFGATLRLLQRWMQFPDGTRPGPRESRLLGRLVPPREAELLIAALDPDVEEVPGESVALALAGWAGAIAREQPLVVAVDDLERAGEGTLLALQRIQEALADQHALLMVGVAQEQPPAAAEALARTLERLGQGPRDNPSAVLRLHLGPLAEADVESLVTDLFHPSSPRTRLARVLWRRSRGNAGLVVELLRRMTERGEAAPHSEADPRLVLNVSPDDLPLPESLARTIRDRYRDLGNEERLWLDRLAVVGGRIEPDFLVRAFQPSLRPEIDRVLTDLVRRGWLVAAGSLFRFARPALRESIYRSLPPDRRQRLHRMAARALEPAPGEPLRADEAWQRAYHLRAAGEWRPLLALVRPLLAQAVRRASPQRALLLAGWGLEALDRVENYAEREGFELDLLEAAADAADRLGAREEERQILDRLADRDIDPEGQPLLAARVYLLHGRYAVATGQYGLARGMLRHTVQLAERVGARELTSEALRRLGHVQGHVGQFSEARGLLRRAAETAVGENQVALALLAQAQIEVLEDWIEPALALVDRALRMLRAADPPRPGTVALAHLLRARIFRSAGRPGRALGAAKHAMQLARQAGERRTEAEASARYAGLLIDLDRTEEGESALRDTLLLAEEIEDRRSKALASLWLAILLWERSDRESETAIVRALSNAREIGFYRAEAVALAIRARIHTAAAQIGQALEDSARAAELLTRHGAELFDRIVITGTRALVLFAAGDLEASRDMARELRRRMRRDNQRIQDPALRRAQRFYSTRLAEAVLSPDGPLYPRDTARLPEPQR